MTSPMRAPTMPRPARRPRLGSVGPAVLVAALAAALVPILDRLIDVPRQVERVSFENPTVYDLSIDVTGGQGDNAVTLGAVRRGATTTVDDVLHQGDQWTFRFSAQGVDAGDVQLDAEQLEDDDWTVAIPTHIGAELAGRGAPPTP